MSIKFPPWIPRAVADCDLDFALRYNKVVTMRLLTDDRLSIFWRWFGSEGLPEMAALPFGKKAVKEVFAHMKKRGLDRDFAHQFINDLVRCFEPPEPLEAMNESDRREQIKDIRKTASHLIGLLRGSKFDQSSWSGSYLLTPEDSYSTIESWQRSFNRFPFADTYQHTVRFDDEANPHHLAFDYPMNCVTEILESVKAWADDQTALGSHFKFQNVVKQKGRRGTKTFYVGRLGIAFRLNPIRDVTISYGNIAALVNAALDLPEAEEISEQSASKTIARMSEELS